jgi:hypothetical protein
MAITFPDPDVLQYNGIHEAISAAGYSLSQINGVWTVGGPGTPAENEAAVQAIINGYNLVAELKKIRRIGIKKERTNHYYLQYPPELVVPDAFLEETHKDLFGNVVEMNLDIWASINGGSKSANAAWQKILDIRAAAKTALNAVSAATTKAQVLAVTVNWPA